MRHLLPLALSLVTLSCAADPGADWYGDVRFTEAERARIEYGAAWLYSEAGLAPPRIDWTYAYQHGDAAPGTIRKGRGPSGAVGECVGGLGGAVYLSTPDEGDALAGLTAHELAHCALGFEHPDDREKSGIMRSIAPLAWSDSEDRQCAASAVCRRGKR